MLYTNGGKAKEYQPPPSAEHTAVAERYAYDLDGRIKTVERPGGHTLSYDYDTAGRLRSVQAGDETLTAGYQVTGARQLDRLIAPGGQELTFSYDGSLLTREQWSGSVASEVGYEYNSDLRLSGRRRKSRRGQAASLSRGS